MADKKQNGAENAKDDATSTDKPTPVDPKAAAAPEKKKGNGHYAHVQIIHDNDIIPLGDELPENFPADSLARLKKLKHVAEVPPAVGGTTIKVDPGTPTEALRDAEIKK